MLSAVSNVIRAKQFEDISRSSRDGRVSRSQLGTSHQLDREKERGEVSLVRARETCYGETLFASKYRRAIDKVYLFRRSSDLVKLFRDFNAPRRV